MYLTSPLSELVSLCDLVSGKPRCLAPSLPRTDLFSHWLEWFEKRGLFCSPKTKSTECSVPLILFKYEKSPMICKQMYNINKTECCLYAWMVLRMGGQPQFPQIISGPVGATLSVGFRLLSGCLWLSCSVQGTLSDIWYWCLGKVCPGFFFLFDLVFIAKGHFSSASEGNLIFGLRVGEEVHFFPRSSHDAIPGRRYTCTVSRDYRAPPGKAAKKGECSKSTQNLWWYIWMLTYDF